MSTAVLMSGQSRTFPQCIATQAWSVYRHYEDVHFFIVWQDSPASVKFRSAEVCVKMLEDKYGADRVRAKLIKDPTGLPMIPAKYGQHAPYVNAAPHPQLLMQHWYQNEVWQHFQATKGGKDFTTIIRMRADNFFQSCVKIADAEAFTKPTCLSPWWGRFGGINDRFAVMNPCAAKHYFTLYPNIQKLLDAGCPFHPESLLLAQLTENGVESLDSLKAEFSTKRADGADRPPEITGIDLAHAHARAY